MFNLLSNSLPPVAPGLSPRHQRSSIRDGDSGTADTIAVMQKLVARGKRDIVVRKWIGKILNGEIPEIPACQNKDHYCYANAIYTFSKTQIKYAFDPHLVEYVEEPRVILEETKLADCDSIVVLMASMFENIGLQSQFVTIKADRERPSEYSHVYLRVQIPGRGWIVADPTVPAQSFGWEAPVNYGIKYWAASTDEQGPVDQTPSVKMSGMGCGGDCGCKSCSGTAGIMTPLSGLGRHGHRRPHPRQQMRGMGALGGVEDTIWSILNGDTLKEIRSLKAGVDDHARQLDALGDSIAAMPEGPQKQQAAQRKAQGEESLRQEFVTYAQLKDKYNTFIGNATAYTGGLYNPGLAGTPRGMGALGVIPAVVFAIAGVAALAALAYAVAQMIAAARGQSIQTKGYIEQTADLVKAGGGVVKETGDTLLKVAAVIALGAVGYTLFKNSGRISGWISRRGA